MGTFAKKPFFIAFNVSVHIRSHLICHALFFLNGVFLVASIEKLSFLTSSLAIDSLYIGKERVMSLLSHYGA